ncbi:unnamed protein product [Triticum turgidum subsp. durum]|uniref:F-box domain-containing protein n=1 Tax=Triticum turgidum subsp. durum TaxID=4567 RepID=A0A9R0TDV6_TRITD|nr:unnamed protein product [Triticum turgidum subsp. durum]
MRPPNPSTKSPILMAPSLPPPRRRRRRTPSPVDNAMREIFLRLPADDPGSLVRAAAVCRSWFRILSDEAFAREYRAFRRAPPMLGFLHNQPPVYKRPSWVSHFVSTTTFSPPEFEDLEGYQVLDSRHGLVLLYSPEMGEYFVVSDLVTHEDWEIHVDPKCHGIMRWEDDGPEDVSEGIRCNAAVLCDKDLCDHLDCHGGPFLVALVGSDDAEGSMALATVYSSKTREWSDVISVDVDEPDLIYDKAHSAVVGNKVYVPCVESSCVLEYDIGEQELSVISVPYEDQDESQRYVDLMGVEDGMLLFASVMKPRLYLWSMEAGPNGAAGWARRRFIELEPLLPRSILLDNFTVSAVGFAEGVSVIFVSTQSGLYTIELSSGRCDKVNVEEHVQKAMPYMSFYIGERGLLD